MGATTMVTAPSVRERCQGCDDLREGVRTFRVRFTGQDASDTCRYCPECAALAAANWNGETESIEPATFAGMDESDFLTYREGRVRRVERRYIRRFGRDPRQDELYRARAKVHLRTLRAAKAERSPEPLHLGWCVLVGARLVRTSSGSHLFADERDALVAAGAWAEDGYRVDVRKVVALPEATR